MYQRMMNDILKQIKAGEVSGVQFKERILDKYDIACELVAFSNSHEAIVRDATVNDLDATTIKQFLGNRFERVLEKKGLTGRCVKMHAFFFMHKAPTFTS